MQVHVLKPIRTDRLGLVRVGKVVDLPEAQANEYLKTGAVELYATKVIKTVPLLDAGAAVASSASPAGQALPLTTSTSSRRGGRRKKTGQ